MDGGDLSGRIRRERRRAGLTMAQLARRAGTSPATIARYEGGWGRFEVYTLRKLAAALGCRLAIRFEALGGVPPDRGPAAGVGPLARLFWDRRLRASDLANHPVWVLERVLEYGQLEDVRWLRRSMGREAFASALARANLASPRTRALWGAPREGEPCTKPVSRRRAGHFWTDWNR